jgi:nicotinate-nucleotide adenylyltransferase
MKKVAFYGGSFDPLHNGHLTIAKKLSEIFAFDQFVFVPAFHAPHKKNKKPTASFHRFAMLCLATESENKIKVSTVELEVPEKPFTFETQLKLKSQMPDAKIFFVIGADSWNEINTWREWEMVLTQTNIIVVTRPDYEIGFAHISEEIRNRIVDLRGLKVYPQSNTGLHQSENENLKPNTENRQIYITDAVNIDISATEIRQKIRTRETDWSEFVPQPVAKYIEKYELYI